MKQIFLRLNYKVLQCFMNQFITVKFSEDFKIEMICLKILLFYKSKDNASSTKI